MKILKDAKAIAAERLEGMGASEEIGQRIEALRNETVEHDNMKELFLVIIWWNEITFCILFWCADVLLLFLFSYLYIQMN